PRGLFRLGQLRRVRGHVFHPAPPHGPPAGGRAPDPLAAGADPRRDRRRAGDVRHGRVLAALHRIFIGQRRGLVHVRVDLLEKHGRAAAPFARGAAVPARGGGAAGLVFSGHVAGGGADRLGRGPAAAGVRGAAPFPQQLHRWLGAGRAAGAGDVRAVGAGGAGRIRFGRRPGGVRRGRLGREAFALAGGADAYLVSGRRHSGGAAGFLGRRRRGRPHGAGRAVRDVPAGRAAPAGRAGRRRRAAGSGRRAGSLGGRPGGFRRPGAGPLDRGRAVFRGQSRGPRTVLRGRRGPVA